MSFDDNASTKSDASYKSTASVIRMEGLTGQTSYIQPGTVTMTGLFGNVKTYKEGDCIYGGFFGKTEFVGPARDPQSPYVTPSSTPEDKNTPGTVPPSMALA